MWIGRGLSGKSCGPYADNIRVDAKAFENRLVVGSDNANCMIGYFVPSGWRKALDALSSGHQLSNGIESWQPS